jgi:signal transduction histidine kinase
MTWSMLFNVGLYLGVSLATRQSLDERTQATLFVDVFSRAREPSSLWRATASANALQRLVGRFMGRAHAAHAFAQLARERGVASAAELPGDAATVHFAERLLAGAVGAASSRVLVASLVQKEPPGMEEVMHILDEASQVIAYSHQLEEKSRALEAATSELRAANERLTELDRLKDDFISTVSHELRTPLTSIRALSEILHDNPDLERSQRVRFLGIVIKESERLTRLINQVLDLAKLESGKAEWRSVEVDLHELVEDVLASTSGLFEEKSVQVETDLQPVPPLLMDRDRLMQVLLNLLSNAVKFCESGTGRVRVVVRDQGDHARIDVADNGIGIRPEDRELVFEKFRQLGGARSGRPSGTGLGLPICRQIVSHFGGRMWVESEPGQGATFSFTLPLASAASPRAAA